MNGDEFLSSRVGADSPGVQSASMPSAYIPAMTPGTPVPVAPSGPSVSGYDAAAVERFFAEIDAERTRLLAELGATRARAERARRLVDSQQTLEGMLRSTTQSIADHRRVSAGLVARLHAIDTVSDGLTRPALGAGGRP